MRVYVVLSEEITSGGYSEPPEYWRIAEIVAAKTHTRARWLALKANRQDYSDIRDWPRCVVRQLTESIMDEGVVRGPMAEHFWRLVPETLRAPDEHAMPAASLEDGTR